MKTKKTMLDYCKQILKSVAFSKALFKKEYRKSLSWLNRSEANELKAWIRKEYLLIRVRT